MTLQLGVEAPDFQADTTEGQIRFHDWLQAKDIFGDWREPKPYIRIVPQPNGA